MSRDGTLPPGVSHADIERAAGADEVYYAISKDQLEALRDMAARLQEGSKARTRLHEGAELWQIVTEIFNGGEL